MKDGPCTSGKTSMAPAISLTTHYEGIAASRPHPRGWEVRAGIGVKVAKQIFPPMRYPNTSAVFAAILTVSLGLGLVYLTIIGRIEAGAAVLSSLGMAGLIGIVVFLRDFAADQEMNDDRGSRR
jgi:hypothetical protein